MFRGTVAVVVMLVLAAAPASGCGPDSDCAVGDRSYRIRMPGTVPAGQRVGALLFAHGFGSHAADVMADVELGRAVAALGIALIAPQSAGVSWASQGSPFFESDWRDRRDPLYRACVG